jgi:hypothetical protein
MQIINFVRIEINPIKSSLAKEHICPIVVPPSIYFCYTSVIEIRIMYEKRS